MPKEYKLGDKVILDNTKVYGLHDTKSSYIIKSGIFFIYNEKIVNNRIRLTDNLDNIGKPCMLTGWVNLSDIIEE